MKIILADDDQISRKIISGFLMRFGYQVQVVNDGAEALGVLKAPSAPQLAIIDWMMPRMSGLEVASKVRELKRKDRVYIILLSSRNSKLDIVKGLEAGADDYLVKPCDLAELQARLRVAERTLKHDQQLRKTIAELENLVRRHNLLGTIASQQRPAATNASAAGAAPPAAAAATPAPTPALEPAAKPVAAPSSTPAPAAKTTPAPAPPSDNHTKLKTALAASFHDVGLGDGSQAEAQDLATGPEFSVILPFYFPGSEKWVDVRFEFDRRGAHGACRALLKRGANSPQELQDVLVELAHLLSGTRPMDELKADGGMFSFTPSPIGNPGSPGELRRQGTDRYIIRAGEIQALVTEFAIDAPIKTKLTEILEPGEIMVDQVSNPANADTLLASSGDVLTRNRISHLHEGAPNTKVRIVRIPETSRPYLHVSF
jgi:CheY-like chemotaxis protein